MAKRVRQLDLQSLAKLAWRNLWRQRRRTAIILIAIALGVWAMIVLAALARGSMEQQIRTAIYELTGHIQIHAPHYRDDPVVEYSMPGVDDRLRAALSQPDVSAWAARVRVPAVITSEREAAGVTFVGIDPQKEKGLSFIADSQVIMPGGRYLNSPDDGGLLLGRKLAERLQTEVGRRVVVMSQDVNNAIADRGYRVVGIFNVDNDASENAYVFTGLHTAQRQLKLGERTSEIAVMTPDRDHVDAPLARLRAAAPERDVQPWSILQPLLVLMAGIGEYMLYIWFAVVFLAMSFGLVNTLLMSVFERTREFGLFQALGMRPRLIRLQVLAESVMLLLVALTLGNGISALTLAALHNGIDLSAFAEGMQMVGISPVIYPAVSANDVAAANLFVIVLGTLASYYPAWRASRYVPVEAITRT